MTPLRQLLALLTALLGLGGLAILALGGVLWSLWRGRQEEGRWN